MAKNGEKWRWRICLFHLSNSPFRHWPPPQSNINTYIASIKTLSSSNFDIFQKHLFKIPNYRNRHIATRLLYQVCSKVSRTSTSTQLPTVFLILHLSYLMSTFVPITLVSCSNRLISSIKLPINRLLQLLTR